VAAVTAQHHGVCALGMYFEDRPPVLRYKDRSPPTMRDLHVEQRRMQVANPFLQLVQKLQCPSGTDVDRDQLSPIRNVNESGSKDNSILVKKASPEIRKIRGVTGFAVGETESREFFVGEWSGRERHRQLGLCAASELREFERFGIRGEERPVGANDTSADVKAQRRGEIDVLDRAVLEYKDAAICGSLRQSADHLAGIERSAGNFLPRSQLAGIGPTNGRFGIHGGSIEFVNARKLQIAGDIQIAKDRGDSPQDIAKTRQISSGSFGQRQSAGVTAGARSDPLGFEYGDSFGRVEAFQIRGSRQAAETSPYDRDVNLARQRDLLRDKIDGPGRLSPTDWVRCDSQRSTLFLGRSEQPSRDAFAPPQGTAEYSRLRSIPDVERRTPSTCFDAELETLGPCDRDFSLYVTDPILRGHRTPLRGSSRPLYFADTPVTVNQRHVCFYLAYSTLAQAGGMQW
jgi:hypothetical protein